MRVKVSDRREHLGAGSDEFEQVKLDSILADADPLLVAAIQEDERRRRRKFLTIGIAGGLIMGSVIAIVLMMLVGPDGAKQVSPKDADRAAEVAAQAWQLWQQRDFARAGEKFEEALKIDPGNGVAWNGLGWAKLNGGDSEAAKKAFEKAVELDPQNGASLNGLGQIAYSRKEFDKAEQHWAKAANAPAAWVSLAKLYLVQGKWDEAQKWAQKAADMDPADEFSQTLLAMAKNKKVEDHQRRLIEPVPDAGGGALTAKGWQFFQKLQFNQAKAAFEAALKQNVNDMNAKNGLGFTLLSLGKPKEAKPHFEAVLKADPNAAGSINGLARCLKAEGKTKEAIELWEKLDKMTTEPNAGTHGLAWAYLEQKQYEKAMIAFERLLEQEPGNPELRKALNQAQAGATRK
jgi:tetratricopeptide (TPR) repeat protein